MQEEEDFPPGKHRSGVLLDSTSLAGTRKSERWRYPADGGFFQGATLHNYYFIPRPDRILQIYQKSREFLGFGQSGDDYGNRPSEQQIAVQPIQIQFAVDIVSFSSRTDAKP